MKTFKIVALSLLVVSLFLGFHFWRTKAEGQAGYLYSRIIVVENGYGYQIFEGEQLLIRQEFIPAINGNKAFQSKSDAEMVAKRVMEKIQKKLPPTIDIQELTDLGILPLTNNPHHGH